MKPSGFFYALIMIIQFISYFRLLSLDVVLGACVSTMFVGNYLGILVPMHVVIALGIAVWIIYTFDHLWDGWKSDEVPSTTRHQFHQKHRKSIFIALMLMIVVGLFLIKWLPYQVVKNGIILVSAVVFYFIGLKFIGAKPSPYKEPLVAIAYAIGVFLGPVSMMSFNEYNSLLILFGIYVLMAFINLMMFSVYELEIDETDNHTSIVRLIGKDKSTNLISLCFILVGLLFIYQLSVLRNIDLNFIVVFTMLTALMAANYSKHVFGVKERYRWLGDAIFYFPIITLI